MTADRERPKVVQRFHVYDEQVEHIPLMGVDDVATPLALRSPQSRPHASPSRTYTRAGA